MRLYKVHPETWKSLLSVPDEHYFGVYFGPDKRTIISLVKEELEPEDQLCGTVYLEDNIHVYERNEYALFFNGDPDEIRCIAYDESGNVTGNVIVNKKEGYLNDIFYEAEQKWEAQRIISSLKPTEALMFLYFGDQKILTKFDVETFDVSILGCMEQESFGSIEDSALYKTLCKEAPLFLRASDQKIISDDSGLYYPLTSFDGRDWVRINEDRLLNLPPDVWMEKNIPAIIGYLIADCENQLQQRGTNLKDYLKKQYDKYYSSHEHVEGDYLLQGFMNSNPPIFDVDCDSVKKWVEQASKHLALEDEIIVNDFLRNYRYGYFYTVINGKYPGEGPVLIQMKEDDKDDIKVVVLNPSTYRKFIKEMPSYGLLVEQTGKIERHAMVKGQKPVELPPIIKPDSPTLYYAAAPAYTALALSQIETIDKDVVDAALSLAATVADRQKSESENLYQHNSCCKFEIGTAPSIRIVDKTRKKLQKELKIPPDGPKVEDIGIDQVL